MSTRTKFVYVFRIKVRKQGPKFIFKVTLREQCAIRVCSCREAIKHPNALGLQSIEEFTQGRVLTTHKRQTLERDLRACTQIWFAWSVLRVVCWLSVPNFKSNGYACMDR